MGSTSSTLFDRPKSTSGSDLSSLLWTLQISDVVVKNRGQVEADGIMAVKIGNKRVSVSSPSKVFWVGVLLKKNGWIHTGVGLHNDIKVEFGNGTSKNYQYLVAHGTAGDDKIFRVNLSFANNLSAIYDSLAEAFDTEVDYSFSPVFAGDSWKTNRFANDVVTKMDYFLGRKFNMGSPSADDTNCVHFSVSMYLHFAFEGESKLKEILYKVARDIQDKNYQSLLNKLKVELNKISA